MASPFLEDLKKSVETGNFNSEAAKKINEIDNLADEKIKTLTKPNQNIDDTDLSKSVNERLEKAGVKTVTEEEAAALNSDYEKKMEEIKQQDIVNKQLATLIEIEEMAKLTISDMLSFANELKNKFAKEFETKNPMFADLLEKINEINMKYNNSVINN